jgi:hypothetical protein
MATTNSTTQVFVDVIAAEMACGIDAAVEHWMAEIEMALTDPGLTTLGRMNAAKEVLEKYKCLTGKMWLRHPANLSGRSNLLRTVEPGIDPAA